MKTIFKLSLGLMAFSLFLSADFENKTIKKDAFANATCCSSAFSKCRTFTTIYVNYYLKSGSCKPTIIEDSIQ